MSAKIILVTGANKGIGFEIVRQLAEKGNTMILTARDKSRGAEAVERLEKQGLTANFIPLDVTSSRSIQNAWDEVQQKFGKLDVLINNAGLIVPGDGDLLNSGPEVWAKTFSTNAEGPLRMAQTFYSLMPGGGRIINISSGGGSMTGSIGGWSPVYCISKTTLNAITRQLDHYLSSRGISVNAVCPGWVRTDMGGRGAPRAVEHGADTAVWLASEEKISSGKFWRDRKVIPW